MTETPRRSIVKTLTWRTTGSGSTLCISYLLTGSFAVAGSIAAVQLISNTILYYLHERVWNRIHWGQQE